MLLSCLLHIHVLGKLDKEQEEKQKQQKQQ